MFCFSIMDGKGRSLTSLNLNACNKYNRAAPTYFVPAQLLPQLEQCRDAMSLLDASNISPPGEEGAGRTKSLIKMKLVPVHPGDEIPLEGINVPQTR